MTHDGIVLAIIFNGVCLTSNIRNCGEYSLVGLYSGMQITHLNCHLACNATAYGRGILIAPVERGTRGTCIYGIGESKPPVCGQAYGVFTRQHTAVGENKPVRLTIGLHLPQPAYHLRHGL